MKKVFLFIIAIGFISTFAIGQGAAAFEKGKSAINVGIGFGNTIYTGYGMGIPSISASYELGIVEIPMGSAMTGVVGVGGILGYDNMKDNLYWGYYWGDYTANINAFFAGVRGNYHFIFVDKLDLYAGIILGFYMGTIKYDWDTYYPGATGSENFSNFYPGAYVGARYFFKPNFGVYSEVGRSISIVSLGVSFAF